MLYLVASPIGNLSDLTFRAEEILRAVDYILAEDTRQSKKLLAHYKISKRLVSFNQHSDFKIKEIVADLKNDAKIALLSDAGVPGLCDPGGKLVRALLEEGLEFTTIPGPSALTALISLCPFDCSQFVFLGYFPKKKGREKAASLIETSKEPVFFFESPHRIIKTVELLKGRLPDRNILIGRELTKKFEEVKYLRLSELDPGSINTKGEFALAIEPSCQTKKNNT